MKYKVVQKGDAVMGVCEAKLECVAYPEPRRAGVEPNFNIKTVYVAGPITPRSTTQNHAVEYLDNIRNMVVAGRKLLMAGYYPFVPGFDFLFFIIPSDEVISESKIKEYSLEWLRRCDAVLFLPGWKTSPGCRVEYREARFYKIPIFYDIEHLLKRI